MRPFNSVLQGLFVSFVEKKHLFHHVDRFFKAYFYPVNVTIWFFAVIYLCSLFFLKLIYCLTLFPLVFIIDYYSLTNPRCFCSNYSGLKSVVTDYIRPVIFGKILPPIAQGLLLALTVLTAAGMFHFIQNDIGVAKAVKRFWALKGAGSSAPAAH